MRAAAAGALAVSTMLCVVGLTGCSRSEDASTGARASGTTSAAEVAKAARGSLSCPRGKDDRRSAAKPPAPDVSGVRPGMTYDEARIAVLCTDPLLVSEAETSRGFNLETFGQRLREGFNAVHAEERRTKSPDEYVAEMQAEALRRGSNAIVDRLEPGQRWWYVATMGLPGKEQAISVARRERYPVDGFLPITTIEQSLRDKYGPPSTRFDDGRRIHLRYAYAPTGQWLSEAELKAQNCHGPQGPEDALRLTPECGLVIGARIERDPGNPDLASGLSLATSDLAFGYRLVTDTEAALAAMEEARRSRALQESRDRGEAPRL